MEFVTFHAWLSPEEAGHPNQSLEVAEQAQLIRFMTQSVKLLYPNASTTLLTNERRSPWLMALACKQVVNAVTAQDLMLERAMAQQRYVLARDTTAPMVFLDSDILLNGSLSRVFERDFDIALTWRPDHEMPINGGLIILNNARPEAAKAFFSRYVGIYRTKYAGQARWFGDQLALRDCVGLGADEMSGSDIVQRDGCRILLLPCDTYNFSPPNRYRSICSRLPEKVVLHFKGERKRLMAPFWRAWLHPSRSILPWVQLVGWQARRRIARLAAEERAAASSAMMKDQMKAAV